MTDHGADRGAGGRLEDLLQSMRNVADDACSVYAGDGRNFCETCSMYPDQHQARKWADELAAVLGPGAGAPKVIDIRTLPDVFPEGEDVEAFVAAADQSKLELSSDQLGRIFEDIAAHGAQRAAWDALSDDDRFTLFQMFSDPKVGAGAPAQETEHGRSKE